MSSKNGLLTDSDFLTAAAAEVSDALGRFITMFEGHPQAAKKLGTLRSQLKPGKMLRSRLGMALCPATSPVRPALVTACAATELIHTATLFHDDVVDGACIRRTQPTLWREYGTTGAILLGDLFYSTGLRILIDKNLMREAASLITKVQELCATEAQHELIMRGRTLDIETSIQIARGKTGPLFAFTAEAAAGDDAEAAAAFEEVGYRLGTAYQLIDDFLDEIGDEGTIGKTLGTDRKRRKFTLAQDHTIPDSFIHDKIGSICESTLDLLAPWPDTRASAEAFTEQFLLSLLPPKVEEMAR